MGFGGTVGRRVGAVREPAPQKKERSNAHHLRPSAAATARLRRARARASRARLVPGRAQASPRTWSPPSPCVCPRGGISAARPRRLEATTDSEAHAAGHVRASDEPFAKGSSRTTQAVAAKAANESRKWLQPHRPPRRQRSTSWRRKRALSLRGSRRARSAAATRTVSRRGAKQTTTTTQRRSPRGDGDQRGA